MSDNEIDEVTLNVIIGLAFALLFVIGAWAWCNSHDNSLKMRCEPVCQPFALIASVPSSCVCANGRIIWRKDIK